MGEIMEEEKKIGGDPDEFWAPIEFDEVFDMVNWMNANGVEYELGFREFEKEVDEHGRQLTMQQTINQAYSQLQNGQQFPQFTRTGSLSPAAQQQLSATAQTHQQLTALANQPVPTPTVKKSGMWPLRKKRYFEKWEKPVIIFDTEGDAAAYKLKWE